MQRLLELLYDHKNEWQSAFGQGMRDMIDPFMNFYSGITAPDIILNGLANEIVELGGKSADDTSSWRFCCILLPQDQLLPLSQRSLTVYAQSSDGPHQNRHNHFFYPSNPSICLSLRAFQSGHVLYRSKMADEIHPSSAWS